MSSAPPSSAPSERSTGVRFGAIPALVAGLGTSLLIFLLLVVSLGLVAHAADQRRIDTRIVAALGDGTIRLPAKTGLDDRRGVDAYTDCLVLQALRLWPDSVSEALFTTQTYASLDPVLRDTVARHSCDVLAAANADRDAEPALPRENYSRYWWGAVTVARIGLGYGHLSVEQYRQAVMAASVTSALFFVVSFLWAYRPVAWVFLPYLLAASLGFGLLILGKSIGQAPEQIAAMTMLAVCNVFGASRAPVFTRALLYGLLGMIAVYFEMLNGVVALIATALICQWTADRLNETRGGADAADGHVLALLVDLALVGAGAAIAVLVRLSGYAMVRSISLSASLSEWTDKLRMRVNGDVPGAEPVTYAVADFIKLFHRLSGFRAHPLHGILPPAGADLLYAIGALCWVAAVPVCLRLARRGQLPRAVVFGFVLAALMVPGWYLVLFEHTLIHAWMTGRLMIVFVGLGMSAVLALAMVWRRQHAQSDLSPIGEDQHQGSHA